MTIPVPLRIPVLAPSTAAPPGTADSAELSSTRERAAAYAHEQEARGRYVVGALGEHGAAALAVVEQDQRTRATLARAETATIEGVSKLVTTGAVATAVTVGAYSLLGPVGAALAVLGGVLGLKLLGGRR